MKMIDVTSLIDSGDLGQITKAFSLLKEQQAVAKLEAYEHLVDWLSDYIDICEETLEEQIMALHSRKMLGLSDEGFDNVPDELFKLVNLEYLDLRWNNLTKLSREIIGMKNLRELYLGGNKLSKIPKSILELEGLEWLTLDGNQLEEMPVYEGCSSSLKILNLGRNKIQQINNIGYLQHLEELHLSENPLEYLPVSLLELTQVKSLVLRNMSLLNWTHAVDLLKKMKNIKLLVVSENGFSKGTSNINVLEYLLEHLQHIETIRVGEANLPKSDVIRLETNYHNCIFTY